MLVWRIYCYIKKQRRLIAEFYADTSSGNVRWSPMSSNGTKMSHQSAMRLRKQFTTCRKDLEYLN